MNVRNYTNDIDLKLNVKNKYKNKSSVTEDKLRNKLIKKKINKCHVALLHFRLSQNAKTKTKASKLSMCY